MVSWRVLLGSLVLVGMVASRCGNDKKEPEKQAPAASVQVQEEPKPLTEQQKKEAVALYIQLRKKFADDQERRFLSNGLDFVVRTAGKDATTIKYTSVLVSRPLLYKLMEEGDLAMTMKSYKFKKAIFSDGYDKTWTYDLEK